MPLDRLSFAVPTIPFLLRCATATETAAGLQVKELGSGQQQDVEGVAALLRLLVG